MEYVVTVSLHQLKFSKKKSIDLDFVSWVSDSYPNQVAFLCYCLRKHRILGYYMVQIWPNRSTRAYDAAISTFKRGSVTHYFSTSVQ